MTRCGMLYLKSRVCHYVCAPCTLTLMTPGKSTSTILCIPGPLTLRDIVYQTKQKKSGGITNKVSSIF